MNVHLPLLQAHCEIRWGRKALATVRSSSFIDVHGFSNVFHFESSHLSPFYNGLNQMSSSEQKWSVLVLRVMLPAILTSLQSF
jgi:hypothetical protein